MAVSFFALVDPDTLVDRPGQRRRMLMLDRFPTLTTVLTRPEPMERTLAWFKRNQGLRADRRDRHWRAEDGATAWIT